MNISIREIKEENKKTYIKFAKDFYNMDAVLHTVPDSNFIDTFEYILRDKTYAEAYMIYNEDIEIGYVLISKTYSQEVASMVLLIEEIYLEENYRNKGFGNKIFNFLFNKFRNYGRLRLEVTEQNTKAIKLYEKLNFKKLEYLQMVIDKEEKYEET